MRIMGMPMDRSVTVRRFFAWRFRSFSMSGSSVGPSIPEFQLRLSFAPSRLFSLPLLVAVQVWAAHETVGEAFQRALVAAEETARIVAKPAIPLFPTVADKAANLI